MEKDNATNFFSELGRAAINVNKLGERLAKSIRESGVADDMALNFANQSEIAEQISRVSDIHQSYQALMEQENSAVSMPLEPFVGVSREIEILEEINKTVQATLESLDKHRSETIWGLAQLQMLVKGISLEINRKEQYSEEEQEQLRAVLKTIADNTTEKKQTIWKELVNKFGVSVMDAFIQAAINAMMPK